MEYTKEQETFNTVLRAFTDSSFKNYKSYGFAAGYFRSLATQMLGAMSKKNQRMFIEEMSRAHDALERDCDEPYEQETEYYPDPDSWYEDQYDLNDF